MLDKVQDALAALQADGTFATALTCGSEELEMAVKGVGPLRFPVSAAMARTLCGVARPAPFGFRDETRHDTSVRDTWQLGRSLVKIDARKWKHALQAPLSVIQRRLGLPEDGKLEARFDKLLIYGPGQFFAPHKDSERSDDMIGTLLIELPSTYTGGALVVEHGAHKKVFRRTRRGKKDLTLLAFYADCTHEVRPVKSGYRIVLTYSLGYRRATHARFPVSPPKELDRLSACIRDYFDTPVQAPAWYGPPQKPDRLTYLLDHEYSEKSLRWDRLKNGDQRRAAALQTVAERLDCEIYLALADVHETWECDAGGYGERWSHGSRHWDEGEDEDLEEDEGTEDRELTGLINSELELRHFVEAQGKVAHSITAAPVQSEVCYTRASRDLNPFKSEHEGWMGNYGNTVDRWYHRAAVVMWPRERTFVIRAKLSPEWAVSELLSQLKAGDLREATERARSLVPFWKGVAPRDASARFVGSLLKVLGAISDAGLAAALLAPLGPHVLSVQTVPAFVALATRHGLPWAQQVFSAWAERPRYDAPSWLNILPRLCAELSATPKDSGRELALWVLEREVGAFEIRHKILLNAPPAQRLASESKRHYADLLALFESAAALAAHSIRERLLAFLLAPATALPLLSSGEFLRFCHKHCTPAMLHSLGIAPLHQQVVVGLERMLAAPPRSAADWSIEPSFLCPCPLCAELAAFLRDPSRIEHAWPLAKDRRQHIHAVIDSYDLPVTHVTTRRGSPFTLVLTKQPALFQRASAVRKKQQELLGWLTQAGIWSTLPAQGLPR